jgi:hypothetical protein
MAMLSPSTLLETWDAGARRHPIDRALLLLSLAGGDAADALPDVPLGDLNRRLMDMRRARFGDRLEVWADCAGCGERMSLELGAGDLPAAPEASTEVEVAGHRFRRPTSRDLASLAGAPDAEAAARGLCRACAIDPETLPEGDALDALIAEVEAALDTADPWADLTLLAVCPACGHRDAIALDVPEILWDEVSATAQGLLDEVHALAAAYGWTERDILAMSEARRAAYIARLAA